MDRGAVEGLLALEAGEECLNLGCNATGPGLVSQGGREDKGVVKIVWGEIRFEPFDIDTIMQTIGIKVNQLPINSCESDFVHPGP